MKRIWVCLLLMAAVCVVWAVEYQVGYGTGEESMVPVNGEADFGWSKMIFTSAELNAAGLVTAGELVGLGLSVHNSPVYQYLNQEVFLRHVAFSAYTATSEPLPAQSLFTQVFSGNLSFHGQGWLQVPFSTVFAWDGTRNLEILWKNLDGSAQTGIPTFKYTATPDYRAAYRHGNGSFPTTNGTRYYNRPNLQLITAMLPNPALPVYPASGTMSMPETTLRWKGGGGCPATYSVFLDTANPPLIELATGITATELTSQLAPNTLYYWKVVPANPAGAADGCPVWSFRTPGASQEAESFEGVAFPPPGWTNPGGFSRSDNFPYHGNTVLYASVGAAGKMIATPRLRIRSTSVLSFHLRDHYGSGNTRVRLKHSQDGSVWTVFGETQSLAANSNWQSFEVSLGLLADADLYLGLEVFSSTGTVYVSLDHIIGPAQPGALESPQLAITRQASSIMLSWSAVDGAAGYKLYSSSDPQIWSGIPIQQFSAQILSHIIPIGDGRFYRLTAFTE